MPVRRAVSEDGLCDSFNHGFAINGIVIDTDIYLDYLLEKARKMDIKIIVKEVCYA